ncbi:MAG: hypothetical protein ACRDOL_27735 [Streptosporangiaceae bacterium]
MSAPAGPHARQVITIGLPAGRWALAQPAAGISVGLARALIEDLPGPGPVPGLSLTRSAPFDGRLGAAVLVACRDRAVICCPAGEITGAAADALTAFAAWAVPGTGVQVNRVRHAALPCCLHPAFATVPGPGRGAGVAVHVCANLVSGGLAATLGVLSTAYFQAAPVPAPRGGT